VLVLIKGHGFQMPNGRARAPRQGSAIGEQLKAVSVSARATCTEVGWRSADYFGFCQSVESSHLQPTGWFVCSSTV